MNEKIRSGSGLCGFFLLLKFIRMDSINFLMENSSSFESKRFVVLSLILRRFIFHYFGQYSFYFRYSAGIAGMCTHKLWNASS